MKGLRLSRGLARSSSSSPIFLADAKVKLRLLLMLVSAEFPDVNVRAPSAKIEGLRLDAPVDVTQYPEIELG